jgi:uncharacterized membrane protein
VQLIILYVATAAVFLILDAIMLTRVLKPLFETHLGGLLADPIRVGPAAVFYLFYIGGLLYFVSVPALREGVPVQALLGGALLGAMAYGTYEFTNYATLRDWHWQMVAVDLTWGTILTGVSAWAGVMITRALT